MSNNTVEVNPETLAAEAQRALAGAASEILPPATSEAGVPGAGGVDPNAPPAQSWRPVIEGLTPMVRMTAFAQWRIPPEHEKEFVDALGATLDLIFPGGLDGKWAPVVRLLAVAGVITITNYKPGEGLPPLGLKKPDADKKPAGAEAGNRLAS